MTTVRSPRGNLRVTASYVICEGQLGYRRPRSPRRDYKEEGGMPWWCTPRVIDRAEACGSDSGLGVVSPRSRYVRTFLPGWIFARVITTTHVRIAIDLSKEYTYDSHFGNRLLKSATRGKTFLEIIDG